MDAKIYLNSSYVRKNMCYRGAEYSVTIQAEPKPVYEGLLRGAIDYLKNAVSVGQSVEVRYDRSIRSCMNKPGLWEDLEAACL